MLKKVGIVAAAGTAAMIALSPLAFADNGDDHDGETTRVWVEENGVERDQVNVCEFSQDYDTDPGLVGVGALNSQTQAGNCVNAGDDAVLPAPPPAPLLP